MENYVYIYLDPRKCGNFSYGKFTFNYEPFYVGVGKGLRFREHIRESFKFKSLNLFRYNKIRKIIKETKNEPIIIKLFEKLSREEANRIEIDLIEKIGRYPFGPLTNLTVGGDGVVDPSQETRKKMSLHCSFRRPEVRKKISISRRGIKLSEETKKKMKESRMGEKNPMFGKRGFGKGKARTKEVRRKIKESWTEDRKRKHGERIKELWSKRKNETKFS
jgi:hypothetical protein